MLLIPEKHQTALRHNNLSKFQGNANLFYTKQRSNISWREFYDFTERPQGITDIAGQLHEAQGDLDAAEEIYDQMIARDETYMVL